MRHRDANLKDVKAGDILTLRSNGKLAGLAGEPLHPKGQVRRTK